MSRRAILIGTAVTALFLTGCGSTTTGTASVTTTASSTADTSSSAMTSQTPSSSSSSSSSSAATSESGTSSVIPAELDAASKTWFTNFCTVASGLEADLTAASKGTPDKSTPQAYQASLSTQFTAIAEVFTGAATKIGSVPAPTIQGGDAFSQALTGALDGIGQALLTATTAFAAVPVTDNASVEAAAATVATGIQQSATEIATTLGSFKNDITPEVQAAVEAIPECSILSK